jgi:hypothetical protein
VALAYSTEPGIGFGFLAFVGVVIFAFTGWPLVVSSILMITQRAGVMQAKHCMWVAYGSLEGIGIATLYAVWGDIPGFPIAARVTAILALGACAIRPATTAIRLAYRARTFERLGTAVEDDPRRSTFATMTFGWPPILNLPENSPARPEYERATTMAKQMHASMLAALLLVLVPAFGSLDSDATLGGVDGLPLSEIPIFLGCLIGSYAGMLHRNVGVSTMALSEMKGAVWTSAFGLVVILGNGALIIASGTSLIALLLLTAALACCAFSTRDAIQLMRSFKEIGQELALAELEPPATQRLRGRAQ